MTRHWPQASSAWRYLGSDYRLDVYWREGREPRLLFKNGGGKGVSATVDWYRHQSFVSTDKELVRKALIGLALYDEVTGLSEDHKEDPL